MAYLGTACESPQQIGLRKAGIYWQGQGEVSTMTEEQGQRQYSNRLEVQKAQADVGQASHLE